MCDDHLIRLFRAATNKTPTAYIRDLRLQEALNPAAPDKKEKTFGEIVFREGDRLILVDYKTDKVTDAAELIDRPLPISAAELAREFSWDKLRKEDIYLTLT